MRGEDSPEPEPLTKRPETPPHAWGRRRRPGITQTGVGNTPTCVGKTGLHPAKFWLGKKHPHMRGEDLNDH